MVFPSKGEYGAQKLGQDVLREHGLASAALGAMAGAGPATSSLTKAGSRPLELSKAEEPADSASLTSSGLLAKHTANIARLAQSFGLSMDNLDADASRTKNFESHDGKFDSTEFKSKLHQMADELQKPVQQEPRPSEAAQYQPEKSAHAALANQNDDTLDNDALK